MSSLQWVDVDEVEILFANHFLVQHGPDEFVLTLGQTAGPAVVGTPDAVRRAAEDAENVPIHPLARVGLTRQRLTELIAILEATLDDHDRVGTAAR